MRPTKKERKIADLTERIKFLNGDYDALAKAGLKKSDSARQLLAKINDLTMERSRLEGENIEDRRHIAGAMLLAISGADFACEVADNFERVVKRYYGDLEFQHTTLIEALRNCAMQLVNIVVVMDKAGDVLGERFAEMSDELMKACIDHNLKTADEIIVKHMAMKGGKNMFITKYKRG